MNNILRVYNYLKKNGLKTTAAKTYESSLYRRLGRAYMQKNIVSSRELDAQRSRRFIRSVRLSVIVPLHNSDSDFLREMIESVVVQSYTKWELIMIDGSDLSYKAGEETAMEYVKSDSRIKYRRLGGNLGISGNTDQGVKASVGQYIVFLDHDDILMPDALYRAALAIEQTGADFLFSDEFSFYDKRRTPEAVTLKPDFGEYTLRGINSIGHMCVVKRELFDRAGGLRRDFDGSQDYDLVLRLSEMAEKTVHLPYVLYGWRIHPKSVAGGIEAKEYCLESAKKAIEQHISRRNIKARLYDVSGAESAYRIKYEIPETEKAKISLVICFKGSEKKFDGYINDILDLVIEKNIEIITIGGYNIFDEVRNIDYDREYDFAAMSNIAARSAEGEYIMFLDSRYKPLGDFIGELLPYAYFEDVGCTGGVLVTRTGFIEACGYRLDYENILKPYLKGLPGNSFGYMRRLKIAHNVSCMSGGFLMVRRKDFISIGGFDERMGVISAGADLCLRLINRGGNVLNPFARAVVLEKSHESFDEFSDLYEDIISEGDKYIREI